jgi:acyl dehydratase
MPGEADTERWVVGRVFETTVVRDLTRTQIVQYAGASGDFNPLHTDDRYAREVAKQPGVFAHGMLTMAMTGRAVTDLVGAAHVRRFGGRFTAQVWPGDDLVVTVTVVEVDEPAAAVELGLSTANQHGTVVFTGYATVALTAAPDIED